MNSKIDFREAMGWNLVDSLRNHKKDVDDDPASHTSPTHSSYVSTYYPPVLTVTDTTQIIHTHWLCPRSYQQHSEDTWYQSSTTQVDPDRRVGEDGRRRGERSHHC